VIVPPPAAFTVAVAAKVSGPAPHTLEVPIGVAAMTVTASRLALHTEALRIAFSLT
jgi:hypothetical protein